MIIGKMNRLYNLGLKRTGGIELVQKDTYRMFWIRPIAGKENAVHFVGTNGHVITFLRVNLDSWDDEFTEPVTLSAKSLKAAIDLGSGKEMNFRLTNKLINDVPLVHEEDRGITPIPLADMEGVVNSVTSAMRHYRFHNTLPWSRAVGINLDSLLRCAQAMRSADVDYRLLKFLRIPDSHSPFIVTPHRNVQSVYDSICETGRVPPLTFSLMIPLQDGRGDKFHQNYRTAWSLNVSNSVGFIDTGGL